MPNFVPSLRPSPATRYSRYWLATLSRAAYYASTAAVQSQVQAATDPPWELAAKSSGSELAPGYVVWRWSPKVFVVALAGTAVAETWYHHVSGSTLVSPAFGPGRVNSFFSLGSSALASFLLGFVGPFSPHATFLLTGHSWGGAVAQVLPWQLRHQLPTASFHVLAFGCPRVGDQAFAAGTDAAAGWLYLAREENPSDPIPHLPPPVLYTGASANVASPRNWNGIYTHAGFTNRWRYAVKPAQLSQLPAPLMGLGGALGVLYGPASGFVRSHKIYFYTLKCWKDAYSGQSMEEAQASAASYGYSLGALDGANALMSQLDGLSPYPLWPVAAGAEP